MRTRPRSACAESGFTRTPFAPRLNPARCVPGLGFGEITRNGRPRFPQLVAALPNAGIEPGQVQQREAEVGARSQRGVQVFQAAGGLNGEAGFAQESGEQFEVPPVAVERQDAV